MPARTMATARRRSEEWCPTRSLSSPRGTVANASDLARSPARPRRRWSPMPTVVHETLRRAGSSSARAPSGSCRRARAPGLRRPLVIAGARRRGHAERLLAEVGAGGSIIGVRVHVPAGHAEAARAQATELGGRLPRLDRRRVGGRAREGRGADRGPADRRRADDVRGLRADPGLGHDRGGPQDDRPGPVWRRACRLRPRADLRPARRPSPPRAG